MYQIDINLVKTISWIHDENDEALLYIYKISIYKYI